MQNRKECGTHALRSSLPIHRVWICASEPLNNYSLLGALRSSEQMLAGEEGEPEGVDEGVEDGGGGEGGGLHPGAAVEESGDGGEEDVAPVGHGRVKDVGEAENDGSDEPSGVAAVERARQQILQQSAK